MGKRIKSNVTQKQKQKNPRNRKNKLTLVFDEKAREEYLTGFRKRKNERRKMAQEQEIEKLKEEKKQVKAKRKAERLAQIERGFGDVPEVEHLVDQLVKPQIFDMASHTVTISDATKVDFVGSSGLMLGANQEEESDQEEAKDKEMEDVDEEEETDKTQAGSVSKKIRTKREFKVKWKRHKNLSHLAHQKKKKLSREDHIRQKRSMMKKNRNKT